MGVPQNSDDGYICPETEMPELMSDQVCCLFLIKYPHQSIITLMGAISSELMNIFLLFTISLSQQNKFFRFRIISRLQTI